MVPESVERPPETWPMSVVLPAPFGPMSAWISPPRTASVTSLVATTPPKRLQTFSSSSIAPARDKSRYALRCEEDDGKQHEADAESRVLLIVRREPSEPSDRVVGDEMLEPEQYESADHTAP